MKNTPRGNSSILIILIVTVLALAGYSLYVKNRNSLIPQSQTIQNTPAIKDDSNLQTVEADLDKINTTDLDTELNRLNSDTSTF